MAGWASCRLLRDYSSFLQIPAGLRNRHHTVRHSEYLGINLPYVVGYWHLWSRFYRLRLKIVVFSGIFQQLKYCTDSHVPLRMNYHNFGGPITFHLVPSSCKKFNLLKTLVCYQTPAKVMKSPSASAAPAAVLSHANTLSWDSEHGKHYTC